MYTHTHTYNIYIYIYLCVCAQSHSPVWFFVIPWTAARQAPLSLRFPGEAYWRGLPFPTPGGLPYSVIKHLSLACPALAGNSLPLSHLRRPHIIYLYIICIYV